MRLCGEAIFEAKEEYNGFKRKATDEEVRDFHVTFKVLSENIEKFKKDVISDYNSSNTTD